MTDAHCHLRDLLQHTKDAERERRETGTACAASSLNREEFEYMERLAAKALEEGAPQVFRCFALHPQLSASGDFSPADGLELLQSLAAQGRLDAVGETGFDLYNPAFRAGEQLQDEMFARHVEIAAEYGLPLVIHVRRAMHKIFPAAPDLKKLPAVIFHSWPGTRAEGQALLGRGINAYFSFGTPVLKNHRQAQACAAIFPADRILLETDAPYQPLRGKDFSSWQDLPLICACIAALRKEAGSPAADPEELKRQTTANFFQAFAPA